MSQSQPGPSRRRRHYTLRACNNCRRRRCKCDGVQPICGTCESSGHECTWNPDSDETRPPTKQYVESLRVKIQMLESEIAQLKQANPHEPSTSTPTPLSTDRSQGLVCEDQSGVDQPQSGYDVPVGSTPEPTTPRLPGLQDGTADRSSTPVSRQPPPIVYQYIFNIDTSIPIEQQTPQAQASLDCQWHRHLPDLGAIQLSRTEHDTILSRCFSYGTSWLSGLVPGLFLRDMVYCLSPETAGPTEAQSQYYSPMLHCSLLAVAVAFSDHAHISARATRERFASHAKQWLDQALKRPTASLVLSLAALAEHHYGLGESAIGFMYMGMSARATRTLTDPDNSAGWCKWLTFAQETLMALGSKLPCDTLVPRTPIDPPMVIEIGAQSDVDSSECFAQNCKLMIIANRIIDNMNTFDKKQQIADTHHQLDAWLNVLPDGLLILQGSSITLPPVLSLHICYWWLVLDLHLPILDRVHSAELDPETEISIKTCDRATDELLHLFLAFDAQHGLRFFPRNMHKAIYTCGYALLIGSVSAPQGTFKSRATAQEGVGTCISALRVICDTWPCAGLLAEELEAHAAST